MHNSGGAIPSNRKKPYILIKQGKLIKHLLTYTHSSIYDLKIYFVML